MLVGWADAAFSQGGAMARWQPLALRQQPSWVSPPLIQPVQKQPMLRIQESLYCRTRLNKRLIVVNKWRMGAQLLRVQNLCAPRIRSTLVFSPLPLLGMGGLEFLAAKLLFCYNM